jgi:hypothetical protein
VLYVVLVTTYLVTEVGKLNVLAPALSALSLVAILISLPAAGWAARALTALFLCAGTAMLYRQGIRWLEYIGAYGDMLYLLALFAVVPVLSEPVRLGGYSEAIQSTLRGRVSSIFQLNCMVTALSFLCGSFLSLASVPIMIAAMGPVVSGYALNNKIRFMVVSAVSGYVLPMLWTPVSGVVGVVLHSLQVGWLSLFPSLFMLSIACLFANWMIFYMLEVRGKPQSAQIEVEHAQEDVSAQIRRLFHLVLAIVLLIVCIVLLEHLLQIGSLAVVTLIAIPFAFVWSITIGQGSRFLTGVREQLVGRVPRMADQFAVFLSAGFFVKAMHMANFDHAANLLFLQLHGLIGTELFLISMPFMALLASFLGVHPLVAIALLGESLKPEVLGITSSQLAITLVGSSVLTFMLGPFSGTLGLVQSITHISAFRLALWNAPYVLGYFCLLVVSIMLF